jgi:hypothetical protein
MSALDEVFDKTPIAFDDFRGATEENQIRNLLNLFISW